MRWIRGPLLFRLKRFLPLDGNGFRQLEGDGALRGEFHVLASRGSGGRKSAARTDARSNRRSLAAAGQAADQRANCRAAAGDNRGALAFTFYRAAIGAGRNCVALPMNFDARQADGQNGFAFKGSLFLRVNDGSVRVRSLGDGCPAFDYDRLGNGGFEFIARLGNFGVNGARQNNGDRSVGRKRDRPRRFRSGFLRHARLVGARLTAVGGWTR